MAEFSLKVRKGPARTDARKLRMSSNEPHTRKALRRKRALERLDKDIHRYQRMAQDELIINSTRTKPGAPFTVAQKLERAQIARTFLAAKPGMGG